MISGQSRNLVLAAIAVTAIAGAGLWYLLSEDERSAPGVQQESAVMQPPVTREPEVGATTGDTASQEAAVEEIAAQEAAEPEITEEIGQSQIQEAGEPAPVDADVATEAPIEPDESVGTEATSQEEIAPSGPVGLAFDIIRIEPSGEAVIAGRGAPDARVALLRNGAVHDETISDASGNFVFIPEPFPVGTSDVTLRATGSDGSDLVSQESLTIVVDEDRRRQPMVARIAPGQPTEVLSRPEPEPPVTLVDAASADVAPDTVVSREQVSGEQVSEGSVRGETVAEVTTTPSAEDRIDGETAAGSGPDAAAQITGIPVADTAQETARETARETAQDTIEDTVEDTTAGRSIAALDATGPVEVPASEPADARMGVRIIAVEAETGGGLFVSGEAEAEAVIRLYLNDTLVTQAEADDAGDISFAIRRGVRAGRYQVRLDDVDPATGTVLSRAEVGFTVPEAVAALPEPQTEPAPATTAQPAPEPTVTEPDDPVAVTADASATDSPPAGEQVAQDLPEAAAETAGEAAEATIEATVADRDSARPEATVTVPELATAIVERGDSLWRISRQVYGRGIRYTEIFEANQDQIRNPDLIFPGQVFVLPPDQEPGATLEALPAQ